MNSQTSRAVVLFGADHSEMLWQSIVGNTLKDQMDDPKEKFPKTKEKLDSFSAAFGTVLFYEDQQVVKEYQEKYKLYAEHFPAWSDQACVGGFLASGSLASAPSLSAHRR